MRPLLAIVAVLTLGLAATQAVGAIIEMKDSADFTYKYEMDVMPDTQKLDGSGKDDFVVSNSEMSVSGGLLSYDIPAGQMTWEYSTNLLADGDLYRWSPNPNFSYAEGFTIEIRARVNSQVGNGTTLGPLMVEAYGFPVGGVTHRGILNMWTDETTWWQKADPAIVLDTNDNSDEFHTWRLAQEGGTTSYDIWRDGVKIATGIPYISTWNQSWLRFGNNVGDVGGNVDIEYFRITPGAFAPVPEPSTVAMLAGGLLCLGVCGRRRRRDCRWQHKHVN